MQKNEVTIVCLGAFGDIINCTPIAKHYKKEGKFVRWITKDKYASVLSNNDYVDEILLLKNSKLNNVSLTRKFKLWESPCSPQIISPLHVVVFFKYEEIESIKI